MLPDRHVFGPKHCLLIASRSTANLDIDIFPNVPRRQLGEKMRTTFSFSEAAAQREAAKKAAALQLAKQTMADNEVNKALKLKKKEAEFTQ